ncbi:MAG TPA: xanthine dehydrogenase family protein molybdopterin-binding subunit [Chloroflexota bacterium]|jgi:CO/xanthine dehydrogenase Mo-binding subunit
MAIRDIDAARIVADPSYAATLTPEEWESLASNADWAHLLEEYGDVVRQNVAMPMAQIAPPVPGPNVGAQQTQFQYVGKKQLRIQGLGVVTNVGWYTENLSRGNQLWMTTLRSPNPHARVKSVDSSDAEKMAGVAMVLHRFNLPREYQSIKIGSGPPDRLLFPAEVFMVGDPVAIVLAESQDIADEAMRLIKVEYEVLPAATNFLDSMQPGAPKQWDNTLDGTIVGVTKPFQRGDPAAGMASSEVKVDHVAVKPVEQHVALELTNSLTWWENDRLNMIYTSQGAHTVRAALASALRLPLDKVHVVQQGYVGSGYGYRGSLDIPEIHAAIASRLTGRPIKNVYTRYEDFTTRTHRPTFRNEVHIGVNKDGTINSLQAKIIADVGAERATAASGAWYTFQMAYKIPNVGLEGVDVMTNRYLAGAYRCVSHPNGTFALETAMEKAAYAIGMDPYQFRLQNLNMDGNVDTKLPWSNPGIKDVLTTAADKVGWTQKWHAPKANQVRPGVYHGIGMALHTCSHGAGGEPATGQVQINGDGTVQIISASNEIGEGSRTMVKIVAAEALGVPWESINIVPYVDTDLTTDTGGSGGSRQVDSGGWGAYDAAMDAKRQLFAATVARAQADAKKANKTTDVAPEDLYIDGKFIKSSKDSSLQYSISSIVNSTGTTIVGSGVHRNDGRWERTAFAAHAAEVEVDTVLNTITVTNYVAVHDVGRVLNALGAEQQVEGGVTMSLGSTLYEEMLTDQATGLPLNGNMLDYRVPSMKDVPDKINVFFIENPKEYGVYGAHGLGEPPMGPPGATIANAVHNAVGVWFDELPITRTRLAAALKQSA